MKDTVNRPDGTKLAAETEDFRVPYLPSSETQIPIIMHHGMGRGMQWWYEWMPILGAARHEVVRYDCRGCGKSTTPNGDWGMDALIDDGIAVIEAHGAKQFHWVGFDSGGLIGLLIAEKRPDLIKSITVINSPFSFRKNIVDAYCQGYPSPGAALRAQGYPLYLKNTNWVRLTMPNAKDGDLLSAWHTRVQGLTPTPVAAAILDSVFSVGRFEEVAAALEHPILTIVGDRAGMCMVEDQLRVYRSMKNGEFAVLPNVGSGVNLSEANLCAQLTVAFLDRVNTGRASIKPAVSASG